MECLVASTAIDSPSVLSILLDEDENKVKLTPSRLIREMKMSTEERTEKLKRLTRKVRVLSETNLKTFRVNPDIVIFQNFVVGNVHSVNVSLLNLLEVSVPLKVVAESSQYFTIAHCSEVVCTKIAPGMSYVFKINFIPEELKDYKHEVTFVTEAERFTLTMLAIGPRPLLSIPDEISLPETVVKTTSEKKIWFQNVGNSCARFSIRTESPFEVGPKASTLSPNEIMPFNLFFKPNRCGAFAREMVVLYESGERVFVKLDAKASEACVYLEQERLRFRETFEGLSDQSSVKLYNHSDYVVRFYWKLYQSLDVEREHVESFKSKWREMKEHESLRGNKLEFFDVIDYKGHQKVYERIYCDEVEEYEANDLFLYQHNAFKIEPISGEMYPHSHTSFTLFFNPDACKQYQTTAYLEIIGKQERLPLNLIGNGLAPLVVLNVDFLNVNQIFVNLVHRFEIVAQNKGPIPAEVSLFEVAKKQKYREITCVPPQHTLLPDECKAFVLEFKGNREGSFVEEVNFKVSDSPDLLTTLLTGEVICPLLSFDVTEVDFGCVALGFSVTKDIHLINTSTVPIYYDVEVCGDGQHPAIKCEDLARLPDKVYTVVDIKELEFYPKGGVAEPKQTVTLTITLTPNIIQSKEAEMFVIMWKHYKVSIKLIYTADVPILEINPPEISIRFSFISYPYNRTITLRNKTEYTGYYYLIVDPNATHAIEFVSKITEGFIYPYEKIEIPLTITVTALGEHELTFYVMVFGGSPLCPCVIRCNGQGPVLGVKPEDIMDFGQVTLLKEQTKHFSLVNESPIPAKFKASTSSNSVFMINPTDFELEPLAAATMETSIYLCNPGKYTDVLTFKILNAAKVSVKLLALGVGTSILAEPELKDDLYLGILLTRHKFFYPLKFTNKGFRLHKIKWSNQRSVKTAKTAERQQTENLPAIFDVQPDAYELAFNNSITVNLVAYHQEQGVQEEDFYCQAMIQGQKDKQIIMSTHVSATFVDPTVELSTKMLRFKIDIGPNNFIDCTLKDFVTIENVTGVPIGFNAELKPPFYILFDGKLNNRVLYRLEKDEKITVTVQFEPDLSGAKDCRVISGMLKLLYYEHTKQESIKLMGEIHYPNVEISPVIVKLNSASNTAADYKEVILKNVSTLPVNYHWEFDEKQFLEKSIKTSSAKILRTYEDLTTSSPPTSDTDEESLAEIPILPSVVTQEEKTVQTDKIYSREQMRHVEAFYLSAYVEEYSHWETWQIQYDLATYGIFEITEPQRNKDYFKAMHNLLLPLVTTPPGVVNYKNTRSLFSLPATQQLKHYIGSVLDITPHEGFLPPHECQAISIGFFPKPDTTIKAKAICCVLGGIDREISIQGDASNMGYELDTDYIDFGRQLFCESSERKIHLNNTGNCILDFSTRLQQEKDAHEGERSLFIQPQHGSINPGKSVELIVKYFSRISGEFTMLLLMEIGYYPPLSVTIHGYASFNQIYCALPRPALNECDIFWQYSSIASLGTDFLRSIISCKDLYVKTKYHDGIPKALRRKLERDDWVVILYSDLFPTTMDLELALERTLAYEYLVLNPGKVKLHTCNRKILTIPGLFVPPYNLDLKSVILGNCVDYTISVCNYGPSPASIRLVEKDKSEKSLDKGFIFELTKKHLHVGQLAAISISFCPIFEKYREVSTTESEEESFPIAVEEEIFIEVQHGASIPIHIKAVVCTPRLSYDKSEVDFGEVKCCNCLRKSLLLTNTGPVGTMFTATLMPKVIKKQTKYSGPFLLKSTGDFVEKGKQYLLDVFFQPTVEGCAEAHLILEVEQNPYQLVVALKGYGQYPSLQIQETRINFGAILPYDIECERQFSVQNRSPFPIEFYFPDFDYEIDREEFILKLLGDYYKTNRFYVPPRVAGGGLPRPFVDFYNYILEQLAQKLLAAEIERQVSMGRSLADSGSKHTGSSSIGSRSTSTKGVSVIDVERIKLTLFEKPRDEFEELLRNQLQCIMNGTAPGPDFDPLDAAFLDVKDVSDKQPTDVLEGVCLLFHGAPRTRFLYVSNAISKKLQLPVYSIDRLFFEGLLSNSCPAAQQINENINAKFMNIASESDLLSTTDEDAMDNLIKKVNLILSGKEKKAPPKGRAASAKSNRSKKSTASEKTSSKGSRPGKKEKVKKEPEVFMDLPVELITEVLKEKLKGFLVGGVVVESLNSSILRKPVTALSVVLNALGNARYIHFILFSYTYNDYCTYKQYQLQKQKEEKDKEMRKVLKSIKDMDADEYEALSNDKREIYREHVLKARKIASEARKGALRRRLTEAENPPPKKVDVLTPVSGKSTSKKGKLERISPVKSESLKSDKGSKEKGRKTTEKKSKSSKASEASKDSTKKGKSKEKLSPEEELMKNSILAFEDLSRTILHTMEYWDKRTCTLVKPLPTGQPKAKKPPKTTPRKGDKKSPTKASESAQDLPTPGDSKIGIPCWVIRDTNPEKEVEQIIALHLQNEQELLKAYAEVKDSLKEVLVEKSDLFSILNVPSPRKEKTSSRVFTISDVCDIPPSGLKERSTMEFEELQAITKINSASLSSKASLHSRGRKPKRTKKHSGTKQLTEVESASSSLMDRSIDTDTPMSSKEFFAARRLLQPGEQWEYRIRFYSQNTGDHKHTFVIEIANAKAVYNVECVGKCDMPTLNTKPEAIYPKIITTRTEKNAHKSCVYVRKSGIFDFGYIFLQKIDENNLFEPLGTELRFKNISALPCAMSICLRDPSLKAFVFEPESLNIEPNTEETLKLFALPDKKAKFENRLLLSIQNNPKVQVIKLSCTGCHVNFMIRPKLINFDHALINQTSRQEIVLENISDVSVFWKIVDVEKIAKVFKFSLVSGKMAPSNKQRLYIEYTPMDSTGIPKLLVMIHAYQLFYDDVKSSAPIYKDFLTISTRVCTVDITYSKEIQLGSVKASVQMSKLFTFFNNGQHEVQFEFGDIKNNDDPKYKSNEFIRKLFTIDPSRSELPPESEFNATVVFLCKKPVSFTKVPIFRCTFSYPEYSMVIENFIVTATGKVHLPKYEIYPSDEMHFGYQLISTEKCQEMLVKNTGAFDFSFIIRSLKEIEAQKAKAEKAKKGKGAKKAAFETGSEGNRSSKASSKVSEGKSSKKSDSKAKLSRVSSKISRLSQESKAGKKKKGRSPSSREALLRPTILTVGPFKIVSSTGKVDPGKTQRIKICSIPREVKEYNETIMFILKEGSARDRKGKPVTLTTVGAVPNIGLDDYSYIFQELYVVESYDGTDEMKQIGPHGIFIIDEKNLFFGNVVLNTTYQINLHIRNVGQIATELHSVINDEQGVYSITPEVVTIEPFSSVSVSLTFKPTAIEVSEATLHITYACPESSLAKPLDCKLYGKGNLPEIEILEPKSAKVVFNATLMGTCSCQDVKFKNVGQIECTVLMEINDDVHDVFSLVPKNDTIKLLKVWDSDEVKTALRHRNSVAFKPEQVASFEMQFVPKFDALFNCTLKLHIVDNPYESLLLSVVGQSYNEEVIIDGLPAKIITTYSSSVSLTTPSVAYDLEFKNSPINTLRKKCFKITNHSKNHTYRFEFASLQFFTFIPAVGHLKPQFSKEIVCTIFTEVPLILSEEKLELMLCKVVYPDPEKRLLSWDERQSLVVWETNQETQTENEVVDSTVESIEKDLDENQETNSIKFRSSRCSGEPKIVAEPDSNSLLYLICNVTADYCSYICSVSELSFPDTFAFQENSQTFEVSNTSQVDLQLEWNLWMDERFPRRINSPVFTNNKKLEADSGNTLKKIHSIIRNLPKPASHESDTRQSATSSATLFSGSGNCSNRSNDSWCGGDAMPFAISPETATIPPQTSHEFCVKFKPQDVFQYLIHLDAQIANLKPDLSNLKILISGRSILPLYHFDLEKVDIDKIRDGRRLCKEVVDANTQVITFEAIGLSEMAIKKFRILNPTADNLSYKWITMQTSPSTTFCFNCLKPAGTIPHGDSTEAAFTFTPRAFGVYETFYTFDVPQHKLSTTFLLHGVARKPKVYFVQPHVDLKPVVLGVEVVEEIVLINDDPIYCKFRILKESLAAPSKEHVLVVDPLVGELEPNSGKVIKLIFQPKRMGAVTFHVKCAIQNMENPIFLGVTGQCLKVKPVVSYENYEGQQITLKSRALNEVRLKPMVPYQKEQLTFTIANAGKTGFYYVWYVNGQMYSDRAKFTFKDQEGYVSANTETQSVVSVTALKNILLKNVKIKLQIPYGPSYVLRLSGTALNSPFSFSFDNYDFGQCLVQKEPTRCYSAVLKFKNTDSSSPIILEHNVKKMSWATINFTSKVVKPRKTEEIPIYFHPMEVTDYHSLIPFLVNSKIFTIAIHGEGVPLQLNLVNPLDRFIDLGSTTTGKTTTKLVKVINNSAVVIDVQFDIWNRLPYYTRKVKKLEPEFDLPEPPRIIYDEKPQVKKEGKGKKKGHGKDVEVKEKVVKKESKAKQKGSKGSKKGKKTADTGSSVSSKSEKKDKKEGKKVKQTDQQLQTETKPETVEEKEKRLIAKTLSILPKTPVRIHPRHVFEFQIKYSPTEAMKSFTEKVAFQVQDTVETICIVKAASLGMNYYLDRNYVDFGSTIHGRRVVQKIILYNAGDIGGKYKWILEKSNFVFKITPDEGKSVAHTETIFTVSFHAAELYQFYKSQAKCIIENYDKPIPLTITGCTVQAPSPRETLKFECPVRESHTHDVPIVNSTYSEWSIKPTVTGQYFSVPSVITIKAHTSSELNVTYRPLCMSRKVPHEGTLSVYLPNQTLLNYKLVGTAKRPLPVEKLFREITCKCNYTETLPVYNWLNGPQEFCVVTQAEKTAPQNKVLYKLLGNPVIVVSANSVRDYKWTIYALKEGLLDLKVIFHNVKTKEYLFYDISLDVKKCGPLGTIELDTCVRKPVDYVLTLENPIKTPVKYTITADSAFLNFEKEVYLASLRERELNVTFNPLFEGSSEATLEAVSDDLGTYVYVFKLTALPPVPEGPIYFTAALGEIISQKLLLKNDRADKTEFLIKFDHNAFYAARGIVLGPNETRHLDIYFEPTDMGKVQGRLTLNSNLLGQYIYPLIASTTPPKPQGPFGVKAGTYKKLNFKNPFRETKTFTITLRPGCFFTPSNTVEVEAKRQARILVGIEVAEDASAGVAACAFDRMYPRTGKMVMECQDHSGTAVRWTFYLEEECTAGTNTSSEKSSRVSVSTKSGRSSKSMKSSTSTKSSKSPKSSSQS